LSILPTELLKQWCRADLNQDGITDLAAGGAHVVVLSGNGNGTFQRGTEAATGSQFTSHPVMADLKDDGLPEAIASNSFNSITVLLNTSR